MFYTFQYPMANGSTKEKVASCRKLNFVCDIFHFTLSSCFNDLVVKL